MNNPYLSYGENLAISFSGGRTSAYMLYRTIEAHGGTLPENVKVLFANTGMEDQASLNFVQECSERWGVHITWLEYIPEEPKFKVVQYEYASRHGEPFEQMIRHFGKGMLPNPRVKSCTAELKIRAIRRYLLSIGWTEWNSFIGIRADEASRARKLRPDYSKETTLTPLVDDEVTKEIVGIFWQCQDFDLELPNINGVTPYGNCTLCYLKGTRKLQSIINEHPEKADWWIRMEDMAREMQGPGTGSVFRLDQPTYRQMKKFALEQKDMFSLPENDSIECFCGD